MHEEMIFNLLSPTSVYLDQRCILKTNKKPKAKKNHRKFCAIYKLHGYIGGKNLHSHPDLYNYK